jgi:hypothetical protein
MSVRTSIVKALSEKLKLIDGTGIYKTNIFNNVYPKLVFWDECNDFPAIYMSTGSETREYLPGNFKWAFLGVSLKLYVKGEDPAQQLEELLEDVEKCIDLNRTLVYDPLIVGAQTTEILINSIITDEGLLAPYGVGEINLVLQYQVM